MTMKSIAGRRAPAWVALGALTAGTVAAVTGAVAAAPAANAADGVTVTPNPRFANTDFEGWGTSLVWFANATGDYPEDLRNELYQAVFGPDGLDLNIARYNIGGQNATDVEDYLRPGGAVDGWWSEDPDGTLGTYGGVATDYESRDALAQEWDPSDPAHYDPDADQTQRWWIDQLLADDQITHWEAFANSAPYFMTESGYVSGGFDSWAQQLSDDSVQDFADYLTTVVGLLEDAHGMEFDTIDPLNEPNTGYWGTGIDGSGNPTGRQEGMQVGPEQQADLIDALAASLSQAAVTDAVISAPDETNPGRFIEDWAAYDAETRANVGQMNVHTYGTGQRLEVRDLSQQADKPLWMSEVEGNWISGGFNPLPIENGLGLAGRIHDDLRELQPDAWVLWQPVEDLYNMQDTGEDLNWGSVFIDFDCEPYDEGGETVYKSARRVADAGGDSTAVEECGVLVNSKFNAMRHFTKYINAGDSLIATDNAATTAAVSAAGDSLTLVHSNTATTDRTITIDLSNFAQVDDGATATAYVTTEADSVDDPTGNALVPAEPVAIDAGSRSVTLTLPAQSISSIVVTGVSGVNDAAPGLVDGETYQLQGKASGLMLDASSGRLRIENPAATAEAGAGQAWTVHEVGGTSRDDIQRVVLTHAQGKVMGATDSDTDVRDLSIDEAAADPETRWIVNTTDGKAVSLVNEALAKALDVGGGSTSAGATVGWWNSNGASNQSWFPRSTATVETTVSLRTDVGLAPALPAEVSPQHAWGTSSAVPVEWDAVADDAWDATGQVTVNGTATDVFGGAVQVVATVDVGGLTVTDPVSLTVRADANPAQVLAALPAEVPGRVGASTQTFPVAVTWDGSVLTEESLATAGALVRVPGEADGLAATAHVLVTEAVASNINPGDGTTASASFTEGGYSVDGTRNGTLNDKAWSNWIGGAGRASDTLTYEYDQAHDITEVRTYYYRDGSNHSWPASMNAEYRADGTWHLLGETAVDSPDEPVVLATEPVTADAVRITMEQHDQSYMQVAEVEVMALAAGQAATAALADLRLDGVTVTGFDPATTAYTATSVGERWPTLTAFAVDDAAVLDVTQPGDANNGSGAVEVTSADGEQTQATTIDVTRQVGLLVPTITGTVTAGTTVSATAAADPSAATVDYAWFVDGDQVATGAELDLTTEWIGRELSVTASASASGFVDSAEASTDAIEIAAPEGWSDSTLATLTVDGEPVEGFDPSTTAYTWRGSGSAMPAVAATASASSSTVEIVQPTAGSPTASVTVTAADGSQTTTTIEMVRSVALELDALSLSAGAEVVATATTDPAAAQVRYEWTIGGETVSTERTFDVPRTATGSEWVLSVTAEASGFDGASASLRGTVAPPADVAPVLDLAGGAVAAGETLGLKATGLTPLGELVVELHSTPVQLETLTADASGEVVGSVTIPADTAPGDHEIVVIDSATGTQAAVGITVTAADDGDVSGTDGDGSGAGGSTGSGDSAGTDGGADAGGSELPVTGGSFAGMAGLLALALALAVGGAGAVRLASARRSRMN